MPKIPKRTGNVAGPPAAPPARGPAVKQVLVTYDGPIDPKDRSTAVAVPLDAGGDEHFPRGQKVATSHSTAERLARMAGHTFTIEPAQPEGDN